MFFMFWLVIFIVLYLLFLLIVEKLKSKKNENNMLLGIEITVIGLILIAISAPNTSDNLFLYLEWLGVMFAILGILVFQRFYRR